MLLNLTWYAESQMKLGITLPVHRYAGLKARELQHECRGDINDARRCQV
jgi:hypothetical protein